MARAAKLSGATHTLALRELSRALQEELENQQQRGEIKQKQEGKL